MLVRIESYLRKFRRLFSRSEWLVHLLHLDYSKSDAAEQGLILLQIDGLSREQFERALSKGRLPFLKKLRERKGHRLLSFYSGLPSTTPAVQGELHYGVRSAVPAFEYYDREAGRAFKMCRPEDAQVVEERLKQLGKGLLDGGSSYSNVYNGGAEAAHYCATSIGIGDNIRQGTPFWFLWFLLLNPLSFVRILVLFVIELFLSFWDGLRGSIRRGQFWNELKFIPTRVAICIGLREMVALNVRIDAVRGLPIIHANFLGYDEQSHRRGPDSRFAHWTLKGIDRSIKHIWAAARRSAHRDYDLWVFSDHGQALVRPYFECYGTSIKEAIQKILGVSEEGKVDSDGESLTRITLLGKRILNRIPIVSNFTAHTEVSFPFLAANGPIAHLYLNPDRQESPGHDTARRFVEEAHVPMVLIRDGKGALAFTEKGEFHLPEEVADALEIETCNPDSLGDDLVRVVHHPHAGDYVFLSTVPSSVQAMSFPMENGAHGGPSEIERTGFALLSSDAPNFMKTAHPDTIRPRELRDMARMLLGRECTQAARRTGKDASRNEVATLRVLTYNVHSCTGMDGRVSPRRIARVIAQSEADIVALQELDCNRFRTAGVDQALEIARHLNMDHHFHPVLELEEEQYGDAILSRFPMRLVESAALPQDPRHPRAERRGVLWVEIELNGLRVQVLNTHLGLRPRERSLQACALRALYLRKARAAGPVLLLGDFNAPPGSRVCRRLRRNMRDAAVSNRNKTWPVWHPVSRIDHVFVEGGWEIEDVRVLKTSLARMASDHFPLQVELRWKESDE